MQQRRLAPELSAASSIVCIWIMIAFPPSGVLAAGGPFDQPEHAPPLLLAQRAGFDDLHPVADPALVLLVVRLVLGPALRVFLVDRVHHKPLHPHDDRLVHLVADHGPDLDLPDSPVFGRVVRNHLDLASPFAFCVRRVSTRARSRRLFRISILFSSAVADRLIFRRKISSRISASLWRSSSAPRSKSSLRFIRPHPSLETNWVWIGSLCVASRNASRAVDSSTPSIS